MPLSEGDALIEGEAETLRDARGDIDDESERKDVRDEHAVKDTEADGVRERDVAILSEADWVLHVEMEGDCVAV